MSLKGESAYAIFPLFVLFLLIYQVNTGNSFYPMWYFCVLMKLTYSNLSLLYLKKLKSMKEKDPSLVFCADLVSVHIYVFSPSIVFSSCLGIFGWVGVFLLGIIFCLFIAFVLSFVFGFGVIFWGFFLLLLFSWFFTQFFGGFLFCFVFFLQVVVLSLFYSLSGD